MGLGVEVRVGVRGAPASLQGLGSGLGLGVELRQQRLECSGFARGEPCRVAGGGEAGERGGGAHGGRGCGARE